MSLIGADRAILKPAMGGKLWRTFIPYVSSLCPIFGLVFTFIFGYMILVLSISSFSHSFENAHVEKSATTTLLL